MGNLFEKAQSELPYTGGAGLGTQSQEDPPPTPPKVNPFVMPNVQGGTQFQGQSSTMNPQSTSHGYLARFGSGSGF